jgi:hypothetical protein
MTGKAGHRGRGLFQDQRREASPHLPALGGQRAVDGLGFPLRCRCSVAEQRHYGAEGLGNRT